jgi:hypothetical protein
MGEKQDIIKEMLSIQHQFIAIEQNGEFNLEEYYDNEGDSNIAKIKNRYNDLSIKLIDLAHAEKGSQR